jgi:transcriptional regulator with XRE-family HTH domain
MILRKLRLRRAWSQETLAQLSGLSVRTIQRLERGQSAGLESLQALASALEVDVSTLQPLHEEPTMTNEPKVMNEPIITSGEEAAIRHVRDIKGFYSHLIAYALTTALLLLCSVLGFMTYAATGWTALGWGLGVGLHGLMVFEKLDLFGPSWERKQVEKRLGRKL